jgi:hypothetical protein
MVENTASDKIVTPEQQMKGSQQCLLPVLSRFLEQLCGTLSMPSKKPVLLS